MKLRTGDLETACFEVGRGSPLVLVHGLADDHRAWRRVLPLLVMRHRVILYDLRGHSQTSLGRPAGRLAQLAGDLGALLDALGLERASLAGFSLGALLAWFQHDSIAEARQAMVGGGRAHRLDAGRARHYRGDRDVRFRRRNE